MRRPPGLWILLSAGVLWLCLQDVYGLRATALIFGKSTSTTTTSTEAPESAASDEDASSTEPTADGSNSTKPALTGNPQLDYIWDPNLPKELNGYNLSDYPFYERVPDEEIEFKCDGLHDGFYASVPHKCQVYHHCLFGTRYDFLCANYTAFDQKTFICHFASEVDCANSKKYWHRNDALYQAASTTTVKPLVIATTPADAPLFTPAVLPPRRGIGGRKRPANRRRRPQYDYYEDEEYDDEYYVERPRGRRKRPRPRPRPIYDDEYDDEYEEDRYPRRGSGRRDKDRKRPYDRDSDERRPLDRKHKDRVKDEYEDEDDRYEEETKFSRRDSNKRKNVDDETDKRSSERTYEKRRTYGESSKRKNDDADEEEEEADRRPSERKRPINRDEEYGGRKPSRKPARRPFKDYDDDVQADDNRAYERPRKSEEKRGKSTTESSQPIIKPVSGTIYDRPRLAPRIKLPVPKNEADKYAYKPLAAPAAQPVADDEYYDEYEEEPLPKPKNSRKPPEAREEVKERKPFGSRPRQSSKKPEDDYDSYERPARTSTKRPKFGSNRESTRYTSSSRKRPVVEEYYEDYEEEDRPKKDRRPAASKNERREKSSSSTSTTSTTSTTTTTTSTTTTTTTEKPEYKPEPVVRIVKRPFLPSRGGNPYSSRGLQPVGAKALDIKSTKLEDEDEDYDSNPSQPIEEDIVTPIVKANVNNNYQSREKLKTKESIKNDYLVAEDAIPESKPVFKPSPVIIKVPVRQKFVATEESQSDYSSVPNRQQFQIKEYNGPRTTQKPKVPERNPLDLNEYDVTLNDALNPTLPNLPVRGFPTGFSAANDYTFSNFQRQRFVLDPVLSPASSDYNYQVKPPRQRYETPANTEQFSNSNVNYKGQYSTISEQNYRPRQTQAYYTSY